MRGVGEWSEESDGARWLVVAAGPSLDRWDRDAVLREADAAEARIVAVNCAFYWLEGNCDRWAVTEAPEHTWGRHMQENEAMIPTMVDRGGLVWCQYQDAPAWDQHYPDVATQPFDYHKGEGPEKKGWVDPGWKTDALWRGSTTVAAMALCCRHGAVQIHVIGADMAGTGGWGRKHYTDEETPMWAARWEIERASFEESIADAAEHGIEISTYEP